jgi:hypothetical protein
VDLEEIEWMRVDWIYLALDWEKWQAVGIECRRSKKNSSVFEKLLTIEEGVCCMDLLVS